VPGADEQQHPEPMNNITNQAGHRRSIIAVVASLALAVVGAAVLLLAVHATGGPPQPPEDASASQSSASPGLDPAGAPSGGLPASPSPAADPAKGVDLGPILTASPPVAIDIPSLGVRTRNFVRLGLASDGSLEVPTDFSSVGWYSAGPSPGQLGPAILAGHVDGHNGPAIFYRLGALRPGGRVNVVRGDGSTARFVVDRIQRFRKAKFPTALVYGSTARAELRLITCGGSFDQKSGHYVDNIVAFAHLVG